MKEALDLVVDNAEIVELEPAQRRLALRDLFISNGLDDVEGAISFVVAEMDGYGALADLMREPGITDILINGPHDLWVERAGVLSREPVPWSSEEELNRIVARLLGRAGGRADRSKPIADVDLPDGSRMHVALAPVADPSPLVSIRRFPAVAYTLADLVSAGMMSAGDADRLLRLVQAKRSIAIAGATGTGKTTLLGALLSCIPARERVVTIEETRELRPLNEHRCSLVTRPPNIEGVGGIGAAELLRSALRMRPDRIVVGEVRGPEALVALEALSTGHEGSMVTVHARSASETCDRMVELALQAASGEGPDSLRARFDRAFDCVLFLDRARDGTRRLADAKLPD